MLDVNPIISSELARSKMRDYEEAAARHRLLKESGYYTGSGRAIKTTVALTAIMAAVVTVVQYVF